MRKYCVRFLAIPCLVCWSLLVLAHHPTGREPITRDVVLARVDTKNEGRIRRLGREHDLWGYVWREGYAVIRTDRNRLPDDAIIMQELGDPRARVSEPWRGTGTIPGRPCYRTVEQTYADLVALASANSQLAQWVDIGDSWEKSEASGGYDLHALILTNQTIPGPKPVFMVLAATHSREMVTAEAVTRFAEVLFEGYGVDPDITWMLDYYAVHIIAHHNPDGRKMAEAQCAAGCSPTWRKNTNTNYCPKTPDNRGADLNRNAGNSFWGGVYSSAAPCNITYRGQAASSEPETSAFEAWASASFSDFRDAEPNDLKEPADEDADGVFISLHSFGDIVFYPWEGTEDTPPNATGLRSLAQKLGYVTTYAACQNCILGPASGTNVDFVYEKLGIPSFTFEMGTSFAESCEAFENTVLPQTLNGLITALRHAHNSYRSPQGPDITSLSFTPSDDGGVLTAIADDTRRAVPGGWEAVEPAHAITDVKYSIGKPPWLAEEQYDFDPTDGVWDETIEEVRASINSVEIAGTQLIFVVAEDASGTQGPPSAIWINTEDLFDNGFESH